MNNQEAASVHTQGYSTAQNGSASAGPSASSESARLPDGLIVISNIMLLAVVGWRVGIFGVAAVIVAELLLHKLFSTAIGPKNQPIPESVHRVPALTSQDPAKRRLINPVDWWLSTDTRIIVASFVLFTVEAIRLHMLGEWSQVVSDWPNLLTAFGIPIAAAAYLRPRRGVEWTYRKTIVSDDAV